MAENLSISLKIVEFSMAILNNDLEATKELVDYFNTQDSSVFGNGFNLYDLSAKGVNEALQYVLENLTSYSNIGKVNWDIKCSRLVGQYTKQLITSEEMLTIIHDTLNDENFKDYQFSGLIRLANVSHNYFALAEIKEKINSSEV